MRVRVRLFGSLRETVGQTEIELELEESSTPEDVWRRLSADHPELERRRRSLAVAVNRRYAAFDQVLVAGDEVVFVPPVSGG